MVELLSLSAIWKDIMMIDLCRRRCAIYPLSSDLTVVWLPSALPGPDWPSHTGKSPKKVIRFSFISPGTQNLGHQSQWSFSFIKLVFQISHVWKTTIYMELNLSWWNCIHFLFFWMCIIVWKGTTFNHILVNSVLWIFFEKRNHPFAFTLNAINFCITIDSLVAKWHFNIWNLTFENYMYHKGFKLHIKFSWHFSLQFLKEAI